MSAVRFVCATPLSIFPNVQTKKGRWRIKGVTQLASEILAATSQGFTVQCSGLTGSLRYKLRLHLPTCDKMGGTEDSVFVESRGHASNRILFVWRKKDVSAVLKAVLPCDVVDDIILRKVCAYAHADSKARERSNREEAVRNTRIYYCDGCGRSGTANDILVSVYHRGSFCDDCIDADDEKRDSKWEDALPFYYRR